MADTVEKNPHNLTDVQYKALKEFKHIVDDILTPHDTDELLLKWLRARNYNAKKAEVYFREMYSFKEVYELEASYESYIPPEMVLKYEFTSRIGFAKDGSIVRYTHFGRGDHFGWLSSLNAYAVVRYACLELYKDELLQRKMNSQSSDKVYEITYIFDMEGFSLQNIMHKCVLESALDLGYLVQDYYPENWGYIFFINVPPYFDIAFNIFKPIMQHTALRKMRVVSKEHVPATLLKYIDDDVLPVFLGGKKVDSNGDPRCSEYLRFGGKVPEKYYASQRSQILMPTDPGVTALWIAARGAHNHVFVVQKPRQKFLVEYRTENGSIHARLLYREFDSNNQCVELPTVDEYLDERDERTNVRLVSPAMRVQSHIAPVSDTFMAPWPGIYIFRFSNAYSWFGSRHLIFRLTPLDQDS